MASIVWNAGHTSLDFKVSDSKEAGAQTVPVSCDQVPPQMFKEDIGVVVEGTFSESRVFTAQRLMVNHSNEYKPPTGADPKHDWKESLTEADRPGKPK